MKATSELPAEYQPAGEINLAANRPLAIGLNLFGLALFFAAGWLFWQAARAIRPELGARLALVFSAPGVLAILLTLAGVVVLHELAHALFFWIYTGTRPKLGLGPFYAFAAAPDWYLPRNQFLVTGLAPLVLLSLLGLAALVPAPLAAAPILVLALAANAAGAIGDLWVAGWLLRFPPLALARDSGPEIAIYAPPAAGRPAMAERWRRLMAGLGAEPAAAEALFAELERRYTASERHYHNFRHIGSVLEMLDELRPLACNFSAVQLAAWFHDVIYDARANDNEAQSAAFARAALDRLGLPAELALRVSQLILATTHQAPSDDVDAQLLMDADLASFASDEITFGRQNAAIRREFDWVPEDEYRAGRLEMLGRFLDRDRIYLTDRFHKKLEARARRNIARQMRELAH
ncbi:MAG: metalloprotease family protein [Candidatus Promineifilaceae bacterium]